MKTRVLFRATVSLAIEEKWQDGATVEQISRDARRKAHVAVERLIPELAKLGIHLGDLRAERVVLDVDPEDKYG